MAISRVLKSLKCKSNSVDDVHHPNSPNLLTKPLLPLSSCSSHALRDVNLSTKPPPSSSGRRKPPPPLPPHSKPKSKPKPPSKLSPFLPTQAFPSLEELPSSHPSRRVVELIFTSRWSPGGPSFRGKIEMLFRVHNPPLTIVQFEAHRAAVRLHGGAARCAADGNEMMRFRCTHSSGAIYDARVATCTVVTAEGKMVEAVKTFAVSGGAHESTGGGGGRRAMLVCRVIAGRVRSELGGKECDSVSVGMNELIVMDHRGVLPCFLIIYKV